MAGHNIYEKSRPARENLASVWLNLYGVDGMVWGGNVAGHNIETLLAPMAFLQVYGTPAELEARFQAVRAAAIVNRYLPMNDDDRKRFAASFNELAAYIGLLAQRAKVAESFLAAYGRKINPKTRKVTEAKRGHRGRDLLGEMVWDIYSKNQKKGNTPTVRRKISRELSAYFGESELSEKSEAPIYLAIYNRERSPK